MTIHKQSLRLCVGPLTLRVFAVPEVVLLAIRAPEDPVTNEVHGQNRHGVHRTKLHRVEGEVACLEGVGERHPGEVADGEHKAEAIGRDVHGSEDSRLTNLLAFLMSQRTKEGLTSL